MNATKRKALMAGLIFAAAAGAMGASAASEGDRFFSMTAAAPLPTDTESPRFDNFEQQASAGGFDPIASADYRLDIVSPTDGATVFNDNGDAFVRTEVVPSLASGDQVELLVDGVPAAAPGTTLEFPLSGVPRGQHVLQARIIDATGNVGSISPSSILYVFQASAISPTP